MKVFISCPFQSLLDEKTKTIKKENIDFFKKLIKEMNQRKIKRYLAIERENFGKKYINPQESTINDFSGMKQSDIVIVIPGNPISGGVHIEVGWASALKKPMHIFLEKGYKYSPVLEGVNKITKVKYHIYDGKYSEELINKIIYLIEEDKNVFKINE